MFDLTSSKLLILAIVALIVVGPKDLPVLLRTVGKYLGLIRRQAAEFRSQLDEALREAEFEQLKKEFEKAGNEVRATVEEGTRSLDAPVDSAKRDREKKSGGEAQKQAALPSEPASDAAALPGSPSDESASGVSAPDVPSSEKTGT